MEKQMTDDLKREIQDLTQQVNYWKDLWSRAANRLLQVDPEFNAPITTTAEELRRLEKMLRNPDPWKDV